MEEFIKKIEDMQRKVLGQMMQQQMPQKTGMEGKEELSYIG